MQAGFSHNHVVVLLVVVLATLAHCAPPPAQSELKKSLSAEPLVVAAAAVVSVADTPSPASVAEEEDSIVPADKLNNFYPGNSDIVGLTKRIYASLGSKEAVDLAQDFKGEYETLNVDGALANKLDALYEMRLEDLQLSVRHAKKMRDLLDVLEGRDNKKIPESDDNAAAVKVDAPSG
jgi:hypothetical protein